VTVRYDLPLTDGDDREIVAARLWLLGAVGVQELPDGLVGWFDQRVEEVPPGGTWTTEPHRDWLASWRAGLAPVRAGRVVVVPSWLVDDHASSGDDVTIVLDPGISFGSGHHATTQLCIEALQGHLADGASVLDVGCGTGVLAIVAALLGAGRVEAVDVDPDAVRATQRNAAANDVAVAARPGSVEAASAPASVVLANLLTPTLHALAERLLAATTPGGTVIASGVASERADDVVASFAAVGGTCVERADRDGWAMLVIRSATSTGEAGAR
jgi:ribosomal protein L11 methyltransferase